MQVTVTFEVERVVNGESEMIEVECVGSFHCGFRFDPNPEERGWHLEDVTVTRTDTGATFELMPSENDFAGQQLYAELDNCL